MKKELSKDEIITMIQKAMNETINRHNRYRELNPDITDTQEKAGFHAAMGVYAGLLYEISHVF